MTYIIMYIKKIILFVLRKYFNIIVDIEIEKNETLKLNPPYLVLGNHSTNWDPFLIAAFINKPISFIASMEFFKKISTRYLLKFAGAIPKIKFMQNSYAVKEIIRKKNNDEIIGIFPEGRRNWDGKTENIIYSTAKLIKMLKIPVVLATLKGTHLAQPRWSRYNRKGKVNITFKKIFDRDSISSMTVEDIYIHTENHFKYDEYSHQEAVLNIYRGKKLAENLELLLFTCPHCNSIDTMESKGALFFCRKCNYQVKYNQKAFFEKTNINLYFKNPRDWNKWQLGNLKSLIISIDKVDKIIINDNVTLLIEIKRKMNKLNRGKIYLTKRGFYFSTQKNKTLYFNLNNIKGANIQYNYIMEFYYDGCLYRFEFDKKHTSAYKWLKSIELVKTLNSGTINQKWGYIDG